MSEIHNSRNVYLLVPYEFVKHMLIMLIRIEDEAF